MIDLSGLGPHLARFRRWLDNQPDREFASLSQVQKAGRLALIGAALALLGAPLLWMVTR